MYVSKVLYPPNIVLISGFSRCCLSWCDRICAGRGVLTFSANIFGPRVAGCLSVDIDLDMFAFMLCAPLLPCVFLCSGRDCQAMLLSTRLVCGSPSRLCLRAEAWWYALSDAQGEAQLYFLAHGVRNSLSDRRSEESFQCAAYCSCTWFPGNAASSPGP